MSTRRHHLAFIAISAYLTVFTQTGSAQISTNFLRDAPQPFADEMYFEQTGVVAEKSADSDSFTDSMTVDREGHLVQQYLSRVSTNYSGRAAIPFDSTRLADFTSGSFMPSAIPVAGEPFHDFGHRANVQGNGSAVQLKIKPVTASGGGDRFYGEATFIADGLTSGDTFGVASKAYVQYNQLVVGLTETAFADPGAVMPVLDLAGPAGTATILSPIGGSTQGRLSYFLHPSGDGNRGVIGNVSVETPLPEVRFTSGPAINQTFSTYSSVPDFVTTWKYAQGDYHESGSSKTFHEWYHLQLGSVFREIGLKNGDRTIDDSEFGWGVQTSGFLSLAFLPSYFEYDALGFSVTVGEGIGRYINDLHVQATNQKTGGNDAILNVDTLGLLAARAYNLGYLHVWNESWQSTVGYSLIQLESVPSQALSYTQGHYGVANLLYHQPIVPNDFKIQNFIVGFEYLYGQKEVVSGDSDNAHRLMFVVNFVK